MVMIRTLSKNGQIAIPKRILKSLGLVPPVKVRVSRKRDAVMIQPAPTQTLSEKPIATFEDLRRHFAKVGITTRDVRAAVRWARRARPR